MGQPSSGTVQTQQGPPEFQLDFARNLMQRAADSPDLQYYSGNQIAPFTEGEQQAQQGIIDYSQAGGQDYASQVLAAGQGALANDINANPFLDEAARRITDDYARQFTETINPRILGEAVNANQVGGSRHARAQELAAGRVAEASQAAVGDLYNRAYGQGLQAQSAELQRAPQTFSVGALPQQTLAGVEFQRRQMEQAQIDQDVAEFYSAQMMPWLQMYMQRGIFDMNLGGEGTSTLSQPESLFERWTGSPL